MKKIKRVWRLYWGTIDKKATGMTSVETISDKSALLDDVKDEAIVSAFGKMRNDKKCVVAVSKDTVISPNTNITYDVEFCLLTEENELKEEV